MPKRLFTELSVTKLRHKQAEVGKQITFYDQKGDGLVLRLNAKGTKSWRVLYWHEGKTRSDGLGQFKPNAPDHMSVKAARNAARLFRSTKSVILAERAEQAIADRDSFKIVAERHFKRYIEGPQLRSAKQMRGMIEKLYPDWGDKPFESIKRSDISHMLDSIEDSRGARAADVTLAILRRIFAKYAVGHNDYSSPIVEGMGRIANPSEHARSRILSDEEIRLLFKVATGTFGQVCKMCLFTAQRRTKVSSMRFSEVQNGVWTIATADREKGNAERLRLPQPALDIIEEQRKLRTCDYVFPASRAKRGYTAYGAGKDALDKLMPDIPPWVIHDLRRTSRSLLSRAGVRPDIAERVLGHAIPGVGGVYDRHHYDQERAQALAKLATLLARIVRSNASGNVVPLARP